MIMGISNVTMIKGCITRFSVCYVVVDNNSIGFSHAFRFSLNLLSSFFFHHLTITLKPLYCIKRITEQLTGSELHGIREYFVVQLV